MKGNRTVAAVPIRCLLPLLVGLLLLASQEASAQGVQPADVSLPLAGGRVTKQVRSFKDLREEGVIFQKLDYSCGAAALSTLLTYFFRDNVPEDVVIGFIFISGQTPEEGLKKYFRRKGFSLLDLKRFVEFRGYKAAGFKDMTMEDLVEVLNEERVPVLLPIKPFGYYHFVVVRGIQGDRVFIADPAVGNITMSVHRFIEEWVDGIGFVVTRQPLARSLGASPSDSELAQITAAGAPSGFKPSSPAPALPSLLTVRPTEPVPDPRRLHPVFERQASPEIPRVAQSFPDDRGTAILSRFLVQRFNASVQLGHPAGNFIDFSPPNGKPIRSTP